ncbi:hypothetical protein [Parasutterella muris]|uniref:hypothetical protein n=1 Tax=Parasutterella muris TaxID=2565572 RepID=UPI00203C41F4|nr:hypothetical protein [Parasutterella muris]
MEVEEKETKETTKSKSSSRSLNASQKRRLRALYDTGEFTAADIAKELGVDRSVVDSYIKNHGLIKGARADEVQKSAMNKAKTMAEQEATLVASRIRETKEEHYKMSMGLAKLTWSEVALCKQNGKPFSTIAANLKALELAAKTLAVTRAERWTVLGLDKDDKNTDALPELVLTELTADQIEQIRNYQEEESLELPDEELNKQFAQRNNNLIDTQAPDDIISDEE